MAKLTNEQLDTLVAKRNEGGFKHTVEVMTMDELKAYKINCVEAIERHERQIAKCKKTGGVMQKCFAENKEVLEGYVAYIDSKVAEAETAAEAPKGMAAIDAFLEAWKERAVNHYMELNKTYREVKYGDYEITEENLKLIVSAFNKRKISDEKITEIMNRISLHEMPQYEIDSLKSNIRYAKTNIWKNMNSKSDLNILDNMYGKKEQQIEYLTKMVERDAERRKATLIARVEKKAGKILDASGLSMGGNLEINGYVKGETKTVHVQTIVAGGWNIQMIHYRVLVK